MKFPHLENSNAWPGIETVDPFDLQVTFDPSVWGPDVEIHLCKTRLDAEYRNIGGWPSAAARDAWFESHSDRSFRLDSEFHVLPGTEIKLPVAFEVLQHYNQIFIDFPMTETEYGNPSVTRFYYFISDVTYRSPSSTGCIVTVDEWSTHMFDIDMRYIDLERGHAPMAEVSVANYLANPMDNSELLTVPDEVGNGTARLKFSAEHVINSGPHYLVFSMTADPEQSPGTIHDESNWRVPVTLRQNSQGGFCTPSVFAIAPSDANVLLERMNLQAPQLMPTIQAVFLVPVRYIESAYNFQLLGITCYHIEPKQRLDNFLDITQDKFGYPSRYRDIAKLYTSPYSWIELTDESGRTQTIAVEETTGRLRVSTIASILAPFLGIDLYVTGIGTAAEDSITWDNLYDHTFRAYGDWTRGLRSWNLPTYAVMQDAETAWDWTTYWQRKQAIDTNSLAYQLAIDVNNLNYSLRGANLDRQLARLRQKQSNDQTQLDLSVDADAQALFYSNATVQNQANADAALARYLQVLSTQSVALAGAQAAANAAVSVESASLAAGQSGSYQDHVHNQSMHQKLDLILGVADAVLGDTSDVTDMSSMGSGAGIGVALGGAKTLIAGISSINSMIAGSESIDYAENAAEASTSQAQLQLKGARMNADQVSASYTLQMSNDQAATDQSIQTAQLKTQLSKDHATAMNTLKTRLQRNSLSSQQSTETAILNGDVALARAQIGSTKGMSDRSALQRKQLQDESLANARRGARLGSPKVYAQPTGSMANYTRPQVLMARIMTQDPGSIATAGDAFLRFGYRMGGRQWTVSTLTPMSHFSYWQGDAMIASDSITEVSRGILKGIFSAGTHIWRNPSEIGAISIYENRGDL